MSREKRYRVPHAQLASALPKKWLRFRTTAELEPHDGTIGQDRAMRAVEVGLSIDTRGFNIFAAGEPGSGKTSTLERILRERAAEEPTPDDLCYVYDFRSPDRPRPIFLPAGKGAELARDMERVVEELERMVPRVLSEGAFGHIRAGIFAETRRRSEALTRRTSDAARGMGLILEEEEDQIRVVPIVDGEPLQEDAVADLDHRTRRDIERRITEFQKHADAYSYARRHLERDHEERLLAAETRAVAPTIEELVAEVTSRYRGLGEDVCDFLDQVKEHAVENHRVFTGDDRDREEDGGSDGDPGQHAEEPYLLYKVNVIVDRARERGAPVVVERVPSAANLCGCFEYRETSGGLITDHSMIRAGSLHQANGGYLLIQAGDLLVHDRAWDALKRSLRHKEVRVEEGLGTGEGRPRLAGALKPGSVPLRLKVILVGTQDLYYLMKTDDDDFNRLFKIKADFDTSMPRTRENVHRLAQFLGQVCREEGYLPLHRTGMARIAEFSSRRAEHRERLITRRAEMLDLLAEANVAARAEGARAIRGHDIEGVLAEIERRHGALMEDVAREIMEGTILLRTEGVAVGQINGIAIYDLLGTVFGVPVRITARAYAGRRGVVNIDREVNLSGAVHDKGALILIGYMGGRFAQNHPLGFSASITFEQSYDEIDGDSASSAELYALLSSLSGRPIRQGVAVTGSVNQMGEIQPIGGVNEKIEGIFQVCKSRGLTEDQGVMIPKTNLKNLVLGREVVEAVRAGRFHVWAVSTIDEGIEVLTGVPAGRRRRDGSWTPGSINDLTQRRLAALASLLGDRGATDIDRTL